MADRGLSYRIQVASELYPLEGLVSLYPGSTPVVDGIPYGMCPSRIDLRLEQEMGTYCLRLVGAAKTPKALADLGSQVLEERFAEACRKASPNARVTDVWAEFLKRYYDTLLVGTLTKKTGFSGFTHTGKVYVSFSQFRFA